MTKQLRRLTLDPKLIPLPLQELIQYVAEQSARLEMPCYLVGGVVRDLLLNRSINDYDVVVEGNAVRLGKALVNEGGGRLLRHPSFKTATWFLDSPVDGLSFLDLVTARSETYERPGALPTVTPATIEDDLRRRDFTINAMAVRLNGDHAGEMLDPLGGEDDLAKGLIRVLHKHSFMDDPTRMLRAVRYGARYGFQIESGTRKLFSHEARSVLSQLSGERLRNEIDLMFREESLEAMLERSAELVLLKAIDPALSWNHSIRERFARLDKSQANERSLWAAWLMDLSGAQIRSLGKRLHFTGDVQKIAVAAAAVFHEVKSFVKLKPSQCAQHLDRVPEEAVSVVAMSLPEGKERAVLEAYLSTWKHRRPTITGDHLKARGIPPGPKYKYVLTRLRAAWVDGEVKSAAEEERLLADLLK